MLRWAGNVNRSLHFGPPIEKLSKMRTIFFFHIEKAHKARNSEFVPFCIGLSNDIGPA